MGVFQAPRMGDPPLLGAEDVDLVDAVEAASGGWMAEPRSLVSAGAAEAADDGATFGDEFHNVHERTAQQCWKS